MCSNLRVPVDAVGAPAAGLHLVGVQAPELELFLEEGAADVCWVVKLSSPENYYWIG